MHAHSDLGTEIRLQHCIFFGGGGAWGEISGNICQVNSSHFRVFFTGSNPVKNALFTGFESAEVL